MTARIKLLSAWFGTKPSWYGRFIRRMARYSIVDWECVPPLHVSVRHQVSWMNRLVSRRLGVDCRKDATVPQTLCDLRPAYAHLFPEKLDGYEWWGWCDLDVVFGRLDHLLPPLMDGHDVVHFKPHYLSGCFVLMRNIPETRDLFLRGPYREILEDPRYHCWDESGNDLLPGTSFYNLMHRSGLRVLSCPDLYSYESRTEPNECAEIDGKLVADGQEIVLYHFMTDKWPLKEAP